MVVWVLSIKQASLVNRAILAKLGWCVNRERDALWAKVLRAKYFDGNLFKFDMTPKSTASSTWCGICYGSKSLKDGVVNRIGDGKDTRFWKDTWFMYGNLDQFIPNTELGNELVQNYLTPTGWNLEKLQEVPPPNIVSEWCAIHAKSNWEKKRLFIGNSIKMVNSQLKLHMTIFLIIMSSETGTGT